MGQPYAESMYPKRLHPPLMSEPSACLVCLIVKNIVSSCPVTCSRHSIYFAMTEYVILVSADDQVLGRMEKMEAHQKGVLHRAFSVFLFNGRGETLLQRRAASKYHSPLLWTNSCCSHPREGESILDATKRRVWEELGIRPEDIQEAHSAFHFTYRAEFDNNLIEHELDHVVIGRYEGSCLPNPGEVEAVRWVSMPDLITDVAQSPEHYTAWFKIILDEYVKHLPNL